MSRAKNNYLSSEQIYDEWKKWKESGVISERMGEYMLTLSRHIMESRSFCRYPQSMKDDMVSDGCLKIQNNLHNMKEEKRGSFFAYWTRCVFTAAITYLRKHYTEQNKRRGYILEEVQRMMQMSDGELENCNYLKKIIRDIENWNASPTNSEKLGE